MVVALVAELEAVPEVEAMVCPVLVTTVRVVAVPSGVVVIVVSVVEPVVLVVPVLVVVWVVPFVLLEVIVEPVL